MALPETLRGIIAAFGCPRAARRLCRRYPGDGAPLGQREGAPQPTREENLARTVRALLDTKKIKSAEKRWNWVRRGAPIIVTRAYANFLRRSFFPSEPTMRARWPRPLPAPPIACFAAVDAA